MGQARTAAARAKELGAADEVFSGELKPAIESADLIYIALPISTTLDVLPEIARHAAAPALVTDACSTKARIVQAAEELFPKNGGRFFWAAIPWLAKNWPGSPTPTPIYFATQPTPSSASQRSRSLDDEAIVGNSMYPAESGVPSPGDAPHRGGDALQPNLAWRHC